MITDNETNFLYLADSLNKKEYSSFCERFEKKLKENNIDYDFLEGTKDIWCRDYMPVQISKDGFVQFKYNPDYLRDDREWKKTISDVASICKNVKKINFRPTHSTIIIDGGNVIKAKDKVIMCDKIFSENPQIDDRKLIKELEERFQVDKIIFVPWDKNDFIDHADGMIRFIEDNRVVINKYGKEDEEFKSYLFTALHNAGLDWEEIPYNPYRNESYIDAKGIYINYLQMKDIVFVPKFGIKEDDVAFKAFERIFVGQKIVQVDSTEIAKDGGALNCITWNIMTE